MPESGGLMPQSGEMIDPFAWTDEDDRPIKVVYTRKDKRNVLTQEVRGSVQFLDGSTLRALPRTMLPTTRIDLLGLKVVIFEGTRDQQRTGLHESLTTWDVLPDAMLLIGEEGVPDQLVLTSPQVAARVVSAP
jgi:hypothetical protein